MIVVTGGAGFIGSAVIWGLNLRGEQDIVAVDHLGTSDKWKNLSGLSITDYLEKDRFRSMVEARRYRRDIQAIYHLGACSSTTEPDGTYLIDNNFQYTKELAEFALESNIRFMYASSAATYGDGALGYRDEHDMIGFLRPLNKYGFSKNLFDLWARSHRVLDRIAGFRFSNVFGPNEYHKGSMRSVPLKAFEQIREKGVVQLFKSHRADFADGEQCRDFLYIKDAVDMVLFFLEHPQVNGVFNIGSGKARTWNDLVQACFLALNQEPQIEYIEMPEDLRERYQYFTELDMGKIRLAGYQKPPETLEDSIRDYVLNYLVPSLHLSLQVG